MGPAVTVRAVVFDLDGLLVDSEPLQIAAWQAFLAGYGKRLDDGLLNELFGLRLRDSARLMIDRLDLPLTLEQVITERDAIFLDSLAGQLRAMPGAPELVAELAERGVPRALATSGHRHYVERALAEIGLAGMFPVLVTAEDVEQGKPAPDCYRLAADWLGLPPEACLAIEDAPLGVRAARAAGLRCLAIPNEHTRSLPGLEEADAILPSLHEVLPWLEAQGWLERNPARTTDRGSRRGE
jgi:HAD superfamily hydrolase (TIGR01509 family)